MKKHLNVLGMVTLLLAFGLSGCIEQTDDSSKSGNNGKDDEVIQYNLEEISLVNHHSTPIDVYVETRTGNGSSVKKSFNLDSYSMGQNYSKNIYIDEEDLLSGENVLVIVTALEKHTTSTSDMALNSGGYRKMEFLFNSNDTIDWRRM